jgi:hypothetical protein
MPLPPLFIPALLFFFLIHFPVEVGAADCRKIPAVAYPCDDEIRLNQMQNLGTHNSFHPHPAQGKMQQIIEKHFSYFVGQSEYRHPPLTQQLEQHGIRHFELDVFADPEGGRFSHIPLLAAVGEPTDRKIPALDKPGFKVLHLAQIDPDSSCWSLRACLGEIKSWSDKNPGHLPIMIMLEEKSVDFLGVTNYLPSIAWTEADYAALEAEILSVIPRDKLITPDDVQADHSSLEQAILKEGWPTLANSRGKFIFTQYHGRRHDSLAGRVQFPGSRPGDPHAAFIVLDDAIADYEKIRDLVGKGYLVRTRSDIDLDAARENSRARLFKAIDSGAQFISTDLAEPNPVINPDFAITLPGGTPALCNPLTAPAWCRPLDIENPDYLATPEEWQATTDQ